MIKIFCLFQWILLVISSLPLIAHTQPEFEPIYLESGRTFQSIMIYDIIRDQQGFMWFATIDGLAKYNGYDLKIFRFDPADSNSLSCNFVYSVCEDHDGSLWIGTTDGLNKFIPTTEKFIHYKHDPTDATSLSSSSISRVYIDRKNILWVGTTDAGLNRYNREQNNFTRFQHDEKNRTSLSHNAIKGLFEDRQGNLWIGTDGGGLNLLTKENQESNIPVFSHFKNNPQDSNSLSNNHIWAICEDSSGALWLVTTGAGLNKLVFNQENTTIRKVSFKRFMHNDNDPASISENHLFSLCIDSHERIWIGTFGGGLNQFDQNTETFIHYKPDPSNPNGIHDNVISVLFEDPAGSLWIGTGNHGVEVIHPKKRKGFERHRIKIETESSFKYVGILSFFEDDKGSLWIGTVGHGLMYYQKQTNTFIPYKIPSYQANCNTIFTMIEGRKGELIIGTLGAGLYEFDLNSKKFSRFEAYENVNEIHRYDKAIALLKDRFGCIWLTTYGNYLKRFDKNRTRFRYYRTDPQKTHCLKDNNLVGILEDRYGNIWISTLSSGLYKIDARNISANIDPGQFDFIQYKYDQNNPRSLNVNTITYLHEAKNGFLWIGTNGGGLNRYDYATNSFKHYTEKEGLCNNLIWGILEDDSGNLWLNTNGGLSKFDPTTEIFRNYDVSDGLLNNEFQWGSYYKSNDGKMYFGSADGFISFDPEQITENTIPPAVVLTGFRVFDEPVIFDTTISTKKQIVLKYSQKVFSFEFAALNFINPHKNNYVYKLEGFDKDWVHHGNNRKIRYTNLNPGQYIFRVKASNNDGFWNEAGASIKIVITPPWWKTAWACLLYFFIFCAIVFGLRYYELRQVRLRNELKLKRIEAEKYQEIDHMKSRFFANISHEFRTPLTLILGPLEQFISKKITGDPMTQYRLMYRYAKRLLNLINQLLDFSRLEAGKMTLQVTLTNVVDLTKIFVSSFTALAERKGVVLKYEAQSDSIMGYIDHDKLEKIMTNLLSNAFKFTEKSGRVTVTVNKLARETTGGLKNDWVEIAVSDTGIGIAPEHLDKIFDRFYRIEAAHIHEHEGTGIGLALTKELVELHHGEIRVESKLGSGAAFIVLLPIGEKYYNKEEIVVNHLKKRFIEASKLPEDQAADLDDMHLTEEKPLSSTKNGSKPRLLIVEDNADVISYLRMHLEQSYRIVAAMDGVQGLAKAVAAMPDLIISDVIMPNMDGFEFCQKVKTDERTSHIPVILLTAKASDQSKIVGLETGADDYVTKPFNIELLLARIKNLIDQRKKLRQRFLGEINMQFTDIAITSADEKFLQRLMTVVEEHLTDPHFDTQTMAWQVGLSRMHLYRKICALTDLSPREFIRVLRLRRAAQLFEKGAGNVAEIAYEVGFNNVSNFAKRFRELFGQSPSEYLAKKSY